MCDSSPSKSVGVTCAWGLRFPSVLLGKHALYISDFENCVSYVKENVKENDIILTLGAGTVTEIGPMLLEI